MTDRITARMRAPANDEGRFARGVPRALLAWFDEAKREMPWRRTPSPYRTLVSELMLQQTVVATVIPYFERFVARFPDLAALAAASEDDVLALWSGLGYYSRARNLHRAARLVMAEHGGVLPADEEALRRLPGVGEYTAAAVASIAFGRPTFALDGNAARVMARLHGERRSIDERPVRIALRARGEALVPRDRPGDFVQAVMELGALVCGASAPACARCPVRPFCAAHGNGETTTIPARTPRAAKRVVRIACVALERDGRVLLVRRPAGTLLGGTWVLPAAEAPQGEGMEEAARRAVASVGLAPVGRLAPTGEVRHVFTHRDVTAAVFRTACQDEPSTDAAVRWVELGRLEGVAVSSFTRKTLACAARTGGLAGVTASE